MVARRGYTRHLVAMIVSGGQTGVDRAALDVAVSLGLARGGWCPHGRRAEDGRVPDRYPLAETPSPVSLQRTLWNVRDADATLILAAGRLRGGTLLTFRFARRLGKPCLVRDPFATRNLAAGQGLVWGAIGCGFSTPPGRGPGNAPSSTVPRPSSWRGFSPPPGDATQRSTKNQPWGRKVIFCRREGAKHPPRDAVMFGRRKHRKRSLELTSGKANCINYVYSCETMGF